MFTTISNYCLFLMMLICTATTTHAAVEFNTIKTLNDGILESSATLSYHVDDDRKKMKSKEVELKNSKGEVLVSRIQFSGDKANYLTSPYNELAKVKALYEADTTVNIKVSGYVSYTYGDNVRLSELRAKRVYKDLIKMGIPENKISYVGMGNKEPLVIEKDDKTMEINRRVEIQFY